MDKRNFSDFKDQITSMANKVFKDVDMIELKRGIKEKGDYALNNVKTKACEYSEKYNTMKNKRDIKKYINQNPDGKIKGYVYIVIGALGIGIFSLLLIGFSMISVIMSSIFPTGSYIGIGIFAGFLIASILFLGRGITLRNRLARFKKYIKLMNGKSVILIRDLAKLSGLKEQFVAKDLQKMSEIGLFLEGHIDEEKTHFMLSNDVYQNYIDLKNQEKNEKINIEKDCEDTKVKSTIEIGRDYIEEISSIEGKLYRDDIVNKIEKLVNISNQIINYVEKNPKKMKDINKFVMYYLPTVIKLINSYSELNDQEIQSDNIKNTKLEIKESIDTINMAFERLLDELFEETAIDISSDISVLETLFKQEGLTEKDFKK